MLAPDKDGRDLDSLLRACVLREHALEMVFNAADKAARTGAWVHSMDRTVINQDILSPTVDGRVV